MIMQSGINPECFQALRAQSQRCSIDSLQAEIQLDQAVAAL
jgi:hypothetical protein